MSTPPKNSLRSFPPPQGAKKLLGRSGEFLESTRYWAAQAVNAVLLDGRNLTEALAASPEGRTRAGAQDLAYRTLRLGGRLQFILRRLLSKPLQPAELLGPLLVGLLELDQALSPEHAAVNEAVEGAARIAPKARGLANAVLRNYLRHRAELEAAVTQNASEQHNLPDWWLAQLRRDWPQHWQAIIAASALHPPMSLRVNRRRSSLEAYAHRLTDSGKTFRVTGECALTLDVPCPVFELPGFDTGEVSVQDLGAQRAVRLMDVADGMRVLDACAAPGGKTAHLLEHFDLDLVALDADAHRLQRVDDNLQRLGLAATLKVADAGATKTWWDGRPFDRILLDAPCTGSGVVRRHPDARWLKRAADIPQMAAQQARLLTALWPLLRPGGKLLYATCSVFRPENHAQVARFLLQHEARPLKLDLPGALDGQLLPTPDQDGFFYAILEKTG